FGTDLARHARDFTGKGVELVHHGVERLLQLKDFAGDVHGDFLGEVAARDRGCDVGDVADLSGQVRGHEVDVVGEVLPGAGDAGNHARPAAVAFGADFARHTRHFGGERVQLVHHGVDGFLQLQNLAAHVDRDLLRQVAIGDRDGDLGDVADLAGQIV